MVSGSLSVHGTLIEGSGTAQREEFLSSDNAETKAHPLRCDQDAGLTVSLPTYVFSCSESSTQLLHPFHPEVDIELDLHTAHLHLPLPWGREKPCRAHILEGEGTPFSLLLFSHQVMSNSLWLHGLQRARPFLSLTISQSLPKIMFIACITYTLTWKRLWNSFECVQTTSTSSTLKLVTSFLEAQSALIWPGYLPAAPQQQHSCCPRTLISSLGFPSPLSYVEAPVFWISRNLCSQFTYSF